MKSFDAVGVCDLLVEACAGLHWDAPTKIQSAIIPHALQGKDIIGIAHKGSGKTGAFALPIIEALLEKKTDTPFFGLVLTPTRERAVQIAEQFEALGGGVSLKTAVLVGGVDMYQQQLALNNRPHIIVATPGCLMDHLTNTEGFPCGTLKYLVLDEADRLSNEKFEKSLDGILRVIPRERRTYLFSATMAKNVKKLQRIFLRNPVKIELTSKYSTFDTLVHQFCFLAAEYKDCYLLYILMELSGKSSIVFTRTSDATKVVGLMLRNLGLRALPFNVHMTQAERLEALNKFRAGDYNIIVTTDVTTRGLDIPVVDMVVNYDIPSNPKDYIHRIGRTARGGRTGITISLVNQCDIEWLIQIENFIGNKLPKHLVEEKEVLVLLERVTEAKRFARVALSGEVPIGVDRH